MNDKIFETIHWHYLNKKGFIVSTNTLPSQYTCNILEKKAGIYVYQLILDKSKLYIGSTFDIPKRLTQHRNSANKGARTCPKFYRSVKKHGWENFRLGVIEYVDISKVSYENKSEIRKIILEREQFYFDKLSPSLNINKIAGSMLGYKHSQEMRKIMSIERKGKSIKRSKIDLFYTPTKETRDNLSLRARNGVRVKVFDDKNNVVNTFPTIASTAKYYDIDHNTISKCIKLGNQINNNYFKVELKDVRVWIYDKQHNIVDVFPTANKAAKFCGTSHTVLGRYLKSGKLWKDKYYFSKNNSLE
jgi:group I intron endonuclease